MSRMLHDVRFALRTLARRPAFAASAIVTLALGVGATTAIFSVLNGVVLRPLPFPQADRVVALARTDRSQPGADEESSVSPMDLGDWDAPSSSLGAMALYRPRRLTLTATSPAELIPGANITPALFRVFEAPLVLGRTFTPEEMAPNGPNVAIVGYGFWKERLGGRPDAIGGSLDLFGERYRVVGVAAAGFDFPEHARVWLPEQNDPAHCGRGCVYMSAVARLAPGATLEQAKAEMTAVAAHVEEAYPGSNRNVGVHVARLQDALVGSAKEALRLLFAAVSLVLLIACANVANLLLARGATRREEVAVRTALGAGRRRIISQLLTESALIALLGGVLGVVLAWLGVNALHAFSPGDIPRLEEVRVSGATLVFALGLVGATTLLFGVVPALQLSGASPAHALREGGRGGAGSSERGIGRAALLVAEVGLSLVLLVGAGLLLRSFAKLTSVDPGYRTDHLVQFALNLPAARSEPERATPFWDELEARLAALPGVSGAAVTVGLPLSRTTIFSSFKRLDAPPPKPGEEPVALLQFISPDYLRTLQIQLLRGRGVEARDRQNAVPVALVNRAAAAKFWPGEDPLGKQIDVGVSMGYPDTLPRTIVGLVGDTRPISVDRPPEPEIYVPIAQAGPGFGQIVLRTAERPATTLAAARAEVRRLEPGAPLRDPGTMDELLSRDLARPRFMLLLVGMFAVLAATLAAIGIYGVVAYLVSGRTREIGVRMALGATTGGIMALIMRQGLAPALLGVAIGVGGSLLTAGLLRTQLYGIPPGDPLTLAAAGVLLVGVAAFACALPARRAARIPPASALRSE